MVTYIDAKNANKYQILFDKAVTALKEHQHGAIPQEELDELSIATLDDYYAYLPYLMTFQLKPENGEDEDIHNYFAKVPLDEDYFKINADARTITIPTAFARNGVGVQGDEIAEVVYFAVDRYFDSVDLASVDNIVIQWQTREHQGISQHFGKSVELDANGREILVFGWPISHELTESAGTIRFAVRLYTVDGGTNTIKYSFSTLPAEVTINATLNYDVINTKQDDDHGALIRSRIKSIGVYNADIPTPKAPTITTNLHVIGLPDTAKIVDLREGIQLAIGAQPTDIGVVGYNWKKFEYGNGEYSESAQDFNNNVTTTYLPVEDVVEGKAYYKLVNNNPSNVITYTLIDQNVIDNLKTDEETGEYIKGTVEVDGEDVEDPTLFIQGDGTYITLYEKLSVVSADTVGIYAVDVIARNKTNSTALVMPATDGIKVPGPENPVVSFAEDSMNVGEDGISHVITEGGAEHPVTLKVRAVTGEAGKPVEEVGDNPQVTLTYAWKKVSADGSTVTAIEDDDTYDLANNNSELTINNLATANLDDSYFAEVTATRNGVQTTKASGTYRVTNAPVKPTISIRVGNEWKNRDYSSQGNVVAYAKMIRGEMNTLSFRVSNEKADKSYYIWMRSNLTAEDYDNNNQLRLAIDVDDKLGELFTNQPGEMDVPLTEDGVFNLIETEFASIADLADGAANGPTYQLPTEAESGYYYCIVVNELNGARVATATPFFNVQ